MLERFTNDAYLNCNIEVDYTNRSPMGRIGSFDPKSRRVTLFLGNPAIASAAKRNDEAAIKLCVALVLASFSLEDSTEWHELSNYNHIDFPDFSEFVANLAIAELEIIRAPMPKPELPKANPAVVSGSIDDDIPM